MAAGALAAAAPQLLTRIGVGELEALRTMFYAYAVLGGASAAIYYWLPRGQVEHRSAAAPLNVSRGVVYKLAALFSVDAFAGGFVVQSLLAVWLFKRFDMSLAAASLFFFWSGVLSAFSYPLAAIIARRIGLVNTMVFTHIPSSLFLILAALTPKSHRGAWLAAVALGAVANRRADAELLRHGGRDPAGTAGRGECHSGTAKPGIVTEPGSCRRFTRRSFSRRSLSDLRRA
jgi:predicted MFS family arabinose efflux permease